jgi:hypothetical protein
VSKTAEIEVTTEEENAIVSYNYDGLYGSVEENYTPSFNPWRVKLLQKNSPEIGEVEGALPGKFIVGPMDGTGRDKIIDSLNVILLDYYTGRIANERGEDGKLVGGTDAKRVCGSLDGIAPFFPNTVREGFGDDPIEISLTDWRQPDVSITITEDSVCDGCPMQARNLRDEDGNWLPPTCQAYHRILLYSVEYDEPLQWQTGSYNVLKPLEGRKRGNRWPGLRKMFYPSAEGKLPAFILENGPHSVIITSESVDTSYGSVKAPVLEYSPEPMQPEVFKKFREIEALYTAQKIEFLDRVGNPVYEEADVDDADAAKSTVDPGKAREALTGKDRKNRRLETDENEL